MIYFDNAATTRIKPPKVYEAFLYYVREIGTSPGRGSYQLGVQASRMLYQARKAVATHFGVPEKTNVIFTKNSTEAINLFTKGFLNRGDHVLISPYEHNAVLRPLHSLKLQGIIDYTVLPEDAINNQKELLANYIRPNTRVAMITLASNLTGQIIFSSALGAVLHQHNITVFVDASQGGGKGFIDMQRDHIDFLAFTGHKDMYGLPGTGGLCSAQKISFPPLIQGGTGIFGDKYTNPDVFPEAYEAGTLNMPAIWSLKAAIDYIEPRLDEIRHRETDLLEMALSGLNSYSRVLLYKKECTRVPTFCFNIEGLASSDVVAKLDEAGICVRGGIHCAILAHEALGTVETGAVRVSLNYTNTEQEIDYFLETVGKLQCT